MSSADADQPRYELAPLYAIRMTGIPFDLLERLETRGACARARAVVRCEDAVREAADAALAELRKGTTLSPQDLHQTRTMIGQMHEISAAAIASSPALGAYDAALRRLEEARAVLAQILPEELAVTRQRLRDSAPLLARHAPFASSGVGAYLMDLREAGGGPRDRSSRERERERHLLMYLQRFCAKNDTFSEFGPIAWGTVVPGNGVRIAPSPGITRREAYFERWAVDGIIAAMNADPEVRRELSPRVNPTGRLEGSRFHREDTDEAHTLSDEELAALARCDGRTPAHALGAPEMLDQLAREGVLIWEVEPYTLSIDGVKDLLDDVRGWGDGPGRRKWIDLLEEVAEMPAAFARETDTERRMEIMTGARGWLEALGSKRKEGDRLLYSATNPLFEECFRESGMVIGEEVVKELEQAAEPWFELWADTFAFIASRLAGQIRRLYETAPRAGGRLSLAAFVRYWGTQGFAHTPAAAEAFDEVRAAFREFAATWPDTPERELTAEDCQFLRRRFAFPRFSEFTAPSADLQLAAASPAAVARGEYEWVVAELHSPMAILQHAIYWACPEPALLSHHLRRMTGGRPILHHSFTKGDTTAHGVLHLFEPLGDDCSFSTVTPVRPGWKHLPLADAEVFLDESTQEVAIRNGRTGELAGSFTRYWTLSHGFHPFLLSRGPHMPRLRRGKVVLQRQSWTVTRDELPGGNHRGTSPSLVVAVERLRARRGLPRWVFVRPTDEALPRRGAALGKARDARARDVKPICVDLESYASMEVLQHWMTEYQEVEISEMLPGPEQLLWQEPEGRRTFELRTLLAPRSRP